MCADVMVAEQAGHVIGLGDCAALLGLRPAPRVALTTGERLRLVAPIRNDRPPVPASTNPAVLGLIGVGRGVRLGEFGAEGARTAKLVIDHPARALCLEQPTPRCVVAVVTVTAATD